MRTFDITEAEPFIVIHRAVHMRGTDQAAALAEMDRRRLWLTADQRAAADLPSETAGA